MNGIAAYQEHAVGTQTRGRLIVMLYDGANRNLQQAIAAIERGDVPERHRCLMRAQDILLELMACLNFEAGGDVARNLQRLYDFMLRHLTHANVENDAGKIREVSALLTELNEAWKAITA